MIIYLIKFCILMQNFIKKYKKIYIPDRRGKMGKRKKAVKKTARGSTAKSGCTALRCVALLPGVENSCRDYFHR
jgi:hypothetical protein